MIQPSRRRFLQTLTGIIAAPAIVKADSLMRIVAPPKLVLFRKFYDGVEIGRWYAPQIDWRAVITVDDFTNSIFNDIPFIPIRYTDPVELP